MPLKTETPDDPGINLTPMVDVVFLLVIFFMVGTQFAETEKYHEINLPSVTDARPITGLPDEIVINVTREGTVLVGREPQTFEQLDVTLQEAHDRYADQIIVVRGDEETQYRAIMTIINACQRAGLANIKLAGRPLQEGPT
jgi:biopolymer transport protein ExbD